MNLDLLNLYNCTKDNPILSFQGDYRFLSNFWICPVVYDGLTYQSSEHAYMAQKTLDEELREKIRMQPTPGKAKQVARTIPIRLDWDDVKIEVMFEVVLAKFSQNQVLKKKLLSTENRYIEEGNTWNDKFWGVCDGEGKNCLGQILMIVRDILRAEELLNA